MLGNYFVIIIFYNSTSYIIMYFMNNLNLILIITIGHRGHSGTAFDCDYSGFGTRSEELIILTFSLWQDKLRH